MNFKVNFYLNELIMTKKVNFNINWLRLINEVNFYLNELILTYKINFYLLAYFDLKCQLLPLLANSDRYGQFFHFMG